jgi:hypothetical protein
MGARRVGKGALFARRAHHYARIKMVGTPTDACASVAFA